MRQPDAANDADTRDICAPLPLYFPSWLRDLPLRVSVSKLLTEYDGVNRAFFEYFAVQSVEQAMTMLRRHHESLLIYTFALSGAQPAFSRDIDWSLLRRGDARGIRTRRLNSTGAPWNLISDDTVFEVRNVPVATWRTRLHLRTGGRDAQDAVHRWSGIAVGLRRLRRDLIAQDAAPQTESDHG